MAAVQTMREKLDCLVQVTGRCETEIVAEAVWQGLTELYRRQVADAYLADKVAREEAIADLGSDAVDDLDYYARGAVEPGSPLRGP